MDAFARYFPTLTPHSELQRRTSALPMLLNHRVDYFIDSRPELEEMLAGAGALAAEYRITDVTRLPLYLGFSDSPRGRELLALFDRRMRRCMPAASWSGSSPAGTGPMRR